MQNTTLPLSLIVNLAVSISPQAPATPSFNQGLIVGPSAVIPSVGAPNPRTRPYTSLAAILTDGFTNASPEYIAAQLYFSQTPAPQTLWIGRQDLTAIQTAIPHAVSEGLNYVVGDIITVTQAGASLGQLKVTAIGAGGAVTGLALVPGSQGTGYAVANGLATTGGSGAGLQVDITAIGETPLQAVQACRLSSSQWWTFMVTDAVKADHIAIAAWAQAATPQCYYFFATADADVPTNVTTDVLSQMQTLGYNRVWGQYTTTQGGAYPNNAYFAAALMGVAMGLNTGLANSYFTMKFKTLVGVTVEPLTQAQVTTIEGKNGNLFLSYANQFSFIEQGVCANGQFFDEVLNLDMLGSDITYSEVGLLASSPAVPQTNPGQTQLLDRVNGACERAKLRGFISPGTWTGQTVLNLEAGDPLPSGYLAQSQPYSSQSTADRQARKSMPIYLALVESGSTHSLTVGVYVQR